MNWPPIIAIATTDLYRKHREKQQPAAESIRISTAPHAQPQYTSRTTPFSFMRQFLKRKQSLKPIDTRLWKIDMKQPLLLYSYIYYKPIWPLTAPSQSTVFCLAGVAVLTIVGVLLLQKYSK